jgi:hypothetical protein
MKVGSRVTDGYFTYTVLAITSDEFVTVSHHGHVLRILKSQLVLA